MLSSSGRSDIQKDKMQFGEDSTFFVKEMVDQPILKSCYFKSPLSVFFVFYVFGHERKFVQAWDTEKNSER